ncbi:hypothetical protein TIFTF001_054668 [Ficus carica]|uniref:Uncharacterized protein n=1 Tax=Ficus carica TaxID=3494 RepID=A0AA88EF76_FICCA|nr:hypothetical protein TIFTF001_054668 [Ficus carica]
MDIDSTESHNLERKEHRGEMRSRNSLKALDVLGKLSEGRKAVLLLRLVYFNMPEKFNGLLHRLELLKAHRLASSDLKPAIQLLERFSANIQRVVDYELQLDKRQLIGTLVVNESFKTVSLGNFKSCHSACWISLDIFLEHIIDGKQLPIKSAIDVLSGPIPHLEARLCVLLSIVPLAIAKVLEDETQMLSSSRPATMMSGYETGYGHGMSGKTLFPRKHGLVSSLQVLGQFSALLCPPPSVVAAANIALSKAALFVQSSRNEKERVDYGSHGRGFTKLGLF